MITGGRGKAPELRPRGRPRSLVAAHQDAESHAGEAHAAGAAGGATPVGDGERVAEFGAAQEAAALNNAASVEWQPTGDDIMGMRLSRLPAEGFQPFDIRR